MRPTIENFLQRGYFPKELPPPFNTFSFGTKYNEIDAEWSSAFQANLDAITRMDNETHSDFDMRRKELKKQYESSVCLKYSISKGKLSRRYIGIPNPLQYMLLTQKIVDGWDDIMSIINQSKYSQSIPKYQDQYNKRTLTTSSSGVPEFIKHMLDASYNKKVELKLDLSKFYPTIYTHSIPWAILGKDKAKDMFNRGRGEIRRLATGGDSKAILYNKADAIDIASRNCQGQQTTGIPVGPDTSFVIAELISSRIDLYLNEFDNEIKGCRYYDDYYLYVDTIEKAEEIFKFLQAKLHEFGLEINESKVRIRKFPFEFVEAFSADLSQFSFKKRFEESLKVYFNIIWKFAEKTPDKISHIFKYALKLFSPSAFDRVIIPTKHWELFENLLFKTMLLDPTILNIGYNILELYSRDPNISITKNKLQELVNSIFKEHIPINQHLEVSWALWFCKKYDLDVKAEFCIKVLEMRDAISCLILLDINVNQPHLIKGTLMFKSKIDELTMSFDKNSLKNEDWLLLYEGVKKGWISRPELIDQNIFFNILKTQNVEFYDLSPYVDFTSYEYVFSHPNIITTEKIKKEVEAKAKAIFNEILNERISEIKEKMKDPFSSWDKDDKLDSKDIKENIEYELKDLDIYNEVYNEILIQYLNDNDVDEKTMIKEYLSQLQYYRLYNE